MGISEVESASRVASRHERRGRCYFAALVLAIGATVVLPTVNSYGEREPGIPPWFSPIVILICLLILAAMLAHEARSYRLAVAIRKHRARRARVEDAPSLVESVARLSLAARIPRPHVYVTEVPGTTMLSVGWTPRRSAIFANLDRLRMLDRDELDGVVAHELSHIRHRDGLVRTCVMFSAGVILFLGYGFVQSLLYGVPRKRQFTPVRMIGFLFFFVTLPFLVPWVWVVGMLIKGFLAEQEYRADAESACLTGQPTALVRALVKLGAPTHNWGRGVDGLVYLYDIIGPSLSETTFESLFDVHPALSDRVRELLRLTGQVVALTDDKSARLAKRRERRVIALVLCVCLLLDALIVWFMASR